MMFELQLVFVGVNAYVPEEKSLQIYMPNGTRMGAGSSLPKNLEAHRPTVWQVSTVGNKLIRPDRLRYFPWSKLEIKVTDGGKAEDIDTSTLLAKNKFPLKREWVGKAPKTAGVVELTQGHLSVAEPCKYATWWDPENNSDMGPLYQGSVIKGVKVTFWNVSQVEISFSSLVEKGETPGNLIIDDKDPETLKRLMIGNVCAEYLLGWEKNNRKNAPDEDFGWLWELVDDSDKPDGKKPVPRADNLGYKFDKTSSTQDVLTSLHSTKGGGGGIGCECNGIVAELK